MIIDPPDPGRIMMIIFKQCVRPSSRKTKTRYNAWTFNVTTLKQNTQQHYMGLGGSLNSQELLLTFSFQAAPGHCHSFDQAELRMKPGEILHIRTQNKDEISPTPEFKSPALPQLFVMDETPYLNVVKKVLDYSHDCKPPLMLYKNTHMFFIKYLVHMLLPLVFISALVWNILRHGYNFGYHLNPDWVELLLVESVAATLPLLSFTFPLAFIVSNYIALAWVLGVYGSSRLVLDIYIYIFIFPDSILTLIDYMSW